MEIGDQVGLYKIESHIAETHISNVFTARHPTHGLVVLKTTVSWSKYLEERLRNEAAVLATLSGVPDVVRCIEFAFPNMSDPCLVLEFLEGKPLSKIRYFPIADALRISARICAAVAGMHALGVIHRDLKPDNIMYHSADGVECVKLIDFGVARNTRRAMARLTRFGDVFGAPGYMSPEQYQNTFACETPSDVFSLGCILYYLIVGCHLFPANAAVEMLRKPMPTASPSTRIPQEVWNIMHPLFAENPRDRPTAQQLLQSLRSYGV